MKKIILLAVFVWSSVGLSAQVNEEQCQVTGCAGEICMNKPLNEDDGIATTCEYKDYYKCYKLSSCVMPESRGTSSKAQCGWQANPEFISCLKENRAPNQILERFIGKPVLSILLRVH